MFVTIRGLPHHILSLIELFAWLGAACRQHTASGKLGLCSPKVAFFQDQAAFSINYELADFDSPKSTDNSSCWYALINNPVIVDAFPTRRRRYGERGLELPLQLMVELGLVDYVTPYKGGLVLNGIQTMFVPIVQHDKSQSIEWHFLYEEDRCIAMAQADEACPSRLTLQQLSEADLTDARHFVGWTSHVDTRFGTSKITSVEGFGDIYRRLLSFLTKFPATLIESSCHWRYKIFLIYWTLLSSSLKLLTRHSQVPMMQNITE